MRIFPLCREVGWGYLGFSFVYFNMILIITFLLVIFILKLFYSLLFCFLFLTQAVGACGSLMPLSVSDGSVEAPTYLNFRPPSTCDLTPGLSSSIILPVQTISCNW